MIKDRDELDLCEFRSENSRDLMQREGESTSDLKARVLYQLIMHWLQFRPPFNPQSLQDSREVVGTVIGHLVVRRRRFVLLAHVYIVIDQKWVGFDTFVTCNEGA